MHNDQQQITPTASAATKNVSAISSAIADKLNHAFNLYAWEDSKDEAAKIVADGIKELEQVHSRVHAWRELSDAGLRLRCGELTSQEIRTIRAVLNAIATAASAVNVAEHA